MRTDAWSVDAELYVLLSLESEALWSSLDTKTHDSVRGRFAYREDEVISREEQTLPPQMADWRYVHISIDEASVMARAASRTISANGLTNMPDTLGWNPLRLVSRRLRIFLEDAFPEGSMFFPFSSSNPAAEKSTPTEFYYWLPRHYLSFWPKPKREKHQWMRPQVWGALGGHDTTWEMYNNVTFQSFVTDLPFWTPSPTFGEIVFRSDIYKSIKAAGLTGFQEAPTDNYLRHTPDHSVGYIDFAKRF